MHGREKISSIRRSVTGGLSRSTLSTGRSREPLPDRVTGPTLISSWLKISRHWNATFINCLPQTIGYSAAVLLWACLTDIQAMRYKQWLFSSDKTLNNIKKYPRVTQQALVIQVKLSRMASDASRFGLTRTKNTNPFSWTVFHLGQKHVLTLGMDTNITCKQNYTSSQFIYKNKNDYTHTCAIYLISFFSREFLGIPV